MIKGRTIRLSEQKWVEVEEEARKLGISITLFVWFKSMFEDIILLSEEEIEGML